MLFFQLMTRRYEHASTVLTSNKGFDAPDPRHDRRRIGNETRRRVEFRPARAIFASQMGSCPPCMPAGLRN